MNISPIKIMLALAVITFLYFVSINFRGAANGAAIGTGTLLIGALAYKARTAQKLHPSSVWFLMEVVSLLSIGAVLAYLLTSWASFTIPVFSVLSLTVVITFWIYSFTLKASSTNTEIKKNIRVPLKKGYDVDVVNQDLKIPENETKNHDTTDKKLKILSDYEKDEVRSLSKQGFSPDVLAREYHVTESAINSLLTRKKEPHTIVIEPQITDEKIQPLESRETAKTRDTRYCHNCGLKALEDDIYCGNCGTRLRK